LHVSPGNANDSGLHSVVAEINTLDVDFVIVNGDISNSGSNEEFFAVKRALDKLRHPLYILPGNHETNWSESAGLLFNKIWGNDRFVFEKKGYRFIGLNTGPYMKMGDGHVKNEDLVWLRERIAQFKKSPAQLILFAHYPIADGLDNWDEVIKILHEGQCKLAFCGHGHRLKLLNFNGIPGIMGRALFQRADNSPGYQIVELRNDSILVTPKVYGKDFPKPAIQFNYMGPDTLKYIEVTPFPDYSINQRYPGVVPFFNYQDSSSIFTGLAIYKNKSLIFGNSTGYIKSIDIKSGKTNWKAKYQGPIFSTPQIIGNTVVFGTASGELTGIDARNGKTLWLHKFGRPVLAEGIVEGNYIYIGCADSAFVKTEAKTGKIIWKYTGIKGTVQGKPALHDKYVVFGAWDTHLYCLDKASGQLVWKWNNGRSQKLFSPGNIVPAISHGKVFLVAPDRFMTALDLKTGKEIWRTNQFTVRESMGMSQDGKSIYAKLMTDTVIAVSALADTFELQWAINAGFGYEHSPCPVAQTDQSVVVTTKNGLVVVLDEQEKKVRWVHKAGNSSANKITISNDKKLWVTFINGFIAAYNIHYK
jgi:outer membrane protein assembly factor BamB/predicted phosphohydrolase